MIARRETAELAKELIAETCDRQKVRENELIIHSDRGPAMTSKTVALLLSDLGVTKSLNRPYVSNDNPYSESQFKTLKYQPSFPERFGSIEDARTFCQQFFDWYNNAHYHSGIAMMTPTDVHYGAAEARNQSHQMVLDQAYGSHPERFVKGAPKTLELPKEAWINKPKTKEEREQYLAATGSGIIIGGVHFLNYVASCKFENTHVVGIFESVANAKRILGYLKPFDLAKMRFLKYTKPFKKIVSKLLTRSVWLY